MYWAYKKDGTIHVKEYNQYDCKEYDEIHDDYSLWSTGEYEADNLEHATHKAFNMYDDRVVQDEIAEAQVDELINNKPY